MVVTTMLTKDMVVISEVDTMEEPTELEHTMPVDTEEHTEDTMKTMEKTSK